GSASRSASCTPGSTSSPSCREFVRQNFCCAMIGLAVVSDVSRKVATPGGTVAAISRMRSSGIGPGPLGIRDTRPIAEAPIRTARAASCSVAMQQIFTRVEARNISSALAVTMYGNCIQNYGRAARALRFGTSTSNARGHMLMRHARTLLSLTAVVALAACTDNSITDPFNDAAGTYQLTVYAGKSITGNFII